MSVTIGPSSVETGNCTSQGWLAPARGFLSHSRMFFKCCTCQEASYCLEHQHPTSTAVQVVNNLFLIQLLQNDEDEDGSSFWNPAPTWKTQTELQAPGFNLTQFQTAAVIWRVNKQMEVISLSLPLALSLCLQMNTFFKIAWDSLCTYLLGSAGFAMGPW